MKTIGILLAGAMACASAHATVYEYDFSAAIQEMVEFSPSTGTGGLVNSSGLSGNTISVGDVVHGHFSYDTATGVFGDFGAGPVYADSTAANSMLASIAGHNLALNAPTSNRTMVQVSNNAAILGGGDGLAIGNASENAAAKQLMMVNFYDPTGTALANDGIPGAIDASTYSAANFSFLYVAKDSGTLMGANGALTSLTRVTSPVPEADTYAMLLGGLSVMGILAGRRRKHSI